MVQQIKGKKQNKKLAKGLTEAIVEGFGPLISATETDQIAHQEKRLYNYFKNNMDNPHERVKDVSIVKETLGTKVLVEIQDQDNNFITKKFDYKKLIKELDEKEIANNTVYGKVLDRFSEFLNHIEDELKEIDYNKAVTLKKIIKEYEYNYHELLELKAEIDKFSVSAIEELKRLNDAIEELAKKAGFELSSYETLTQASIRELLDKDHLSTIDFDFITTAISYLKEKVKKNANLAKYSTFSKLSNTKKLEISYYEMLLDILLDYQFDLYREHVVNGEMVSKLFIENSQKSKRKTNELMTKVLNDEDLEEKEYIDLAFMDMEYNKMNLYILLKSHTLDDINKRVELYKRLINKDSKHEELYKKKIDILKCWKRLICIFKGKDDSLRVFTYDLFHMHLKDVKDYVESYNINEEYDDSKNSFDYQYYLMLKKIIEFIESNRIDKDSDMSSIKEYVENCLRVIDKDDYLIKISKTLRRVGENYPKDIFDYKKVIQACYNSYSKLATPLDVFSSTNELRKIVDTQVANVEQNMPTEIVNMIKEDNLVIPKKYVK